MKCYLVAVFCYVNLKWAVKLTGCSTQRCRARKQKCDGLQDTCSTCKRLGLRCHYKAHLAPKPDQKKLYIAALEDRVAELESFLSKRGYGSVGGDHWNEKQNDYTNEPEPQQEPPQGTGMDMLLGAVKDLVSSTSTHYEGGPTRATSTLGRMALSSVVRTQASPNYDQSTAEETGASSEKVSSSELLESNGPMFVSSEIAARLLDAYINHVSTRYPVIHTPRLREIHGKRNDGLDVWEQSILHLCYANAGRILESV